MSPLALLAIFVAPACSQLLLRLGPVDDDSHSESHNIAVPAGFVVAQSLPMMRSVEHSPLQEIVQQLTSGVEDDESSPEQMFQQFPCKSLLRRSRMGFSQPSPEQMLKTFMMNTMEDDSLFSRPSMSSSSYSRSHTVSDGDGRVEVQQTRCQDGICITRKSTSSSSPSINPFAKMKSLRAMQPQVDLPFVNTVMLNSPAQDVASNEPAAREQVEVKVPEILVKQDAAPAAPSSKKETLVQDLADLASVLEKGMKAAPSKEEKRGPAAVAGLSKEEHVMEV